MEIIIKPGHMTLSELRTVYYNNVKMAIHETAYEPMKRSVQFVQQILEENQTTYGVNTGIGKLENTRINNVDLELLQYSIVVSHAVGVGPPINEGLCRLIIALKINSLGQGFSGITPEVLEALVTLVNFEVYPHIPVKGSVGASGDLAPLSHMASVILGEGKVIYKGEVLPALEGLKIAGLKPVVLGPREGVALINGTQVSTAYALRGLFESEDMLQAAIVCGALTVEAAMGSWKPFDDRVHKARGHKGQIDVAEAFRYLLDEPSELSESHKCCQKVQDPYSLRCQPQVLGACLTQIRNSADVLLTEANSVSDNPLIFVDEEDIISAGNFHAEPVAFAADNLALALAEIGSLSERRTSLLMDKHMSQLPPFLVHNGGVNTGFMTAHVTAAALTSENKTLAFPSSVDSIPTSANQEDHVSMAPGAGKRLWEMSDNVANILAVEFLSSCQGIDLRGLKTSKVLQKAHSMLRKTVAFLDKDRFLASDIEKAYEFVKSGKLGNMLRINLVPSQEKVYNGCISNGYH